MADKSSDQAQKKSQRWTLTRRAARLAAVQALYQIDTVPQPVNAVAAEFATHRLPEMAERYDAGRADAKLFEDILRGAITNQADIDAMIQAVLSDDWTLERLDRVIRALLRAGTYEIAYRSDIPRGVIVNEYIEVARAFYDSVEIGLVNGILDRLGDHLRPEEGKGVRFDKSAITGGR